MSDSLVIGGITYNNVAGFKATDSNDDTLTYIRPDGNINITENGSNIDVSGYATASVSVSGGGSPTIDSLSIIPSENEQTFNSSSVDGYKPVTVDAISSTYVGSGIARKSSTDLTVSEATVTAPAGYYASNASKSVANGSATGPSSLSGSSATVTTGTNTLTLTKTGVTTTPTVSAGYVSSATASTATVALTASVTTKAAATITPSTSDQTIASGTYLTGTQTIEGDANLIAGNIKKDIPIFGVTGTYEGSGGSSGIPYKTGTYTPTETYNTTGNRQICTVSDIGFTPKVFILKVTNNSDVSGTQYAVLHSIYNGRCSWNVRATTRYSNSRNNVASTATATSWSNQTNFYLYLSNGVIYLRTTSAYILVKDVSYTWEAYGE